MSGIERIAAERRRQIEGEGWTLDRDAELYPGEQLAVAASCYAMPSLLRRYTRTSHVWPWDETWWKPTPDDRIRELAKAGALIAAEIDRLEGQAS